MSQGSGGEALFLRQDRDAPALGAAVLTVLLGAAGCSAHPCLPSPALNNMRAPAPAPHRRPPANPARFVRPCCLLSFLSRAVLSDDGQGADKHKMERFLQPGGSFVGSVYGPISYPPLPLLAFKVVQGADRVTLAAAGALRSVDPDRLVIKKIVLTGGRRPVAPGAVFVCLRKGACEGEAGEVGRCCSQGACRPAAWHSHVYRDCI